MKSQSSKSASINSTSSKSKKSSKDKEKRKSQSSSQPGATDSSSNEKGSPSKDSKQYAGIGSDSIRIYAEQATDENVPEDVCNTLSEDINYKLRYIIHDALLKARLSGRNAVDSSDIEQTFHNLSIEKVYGVPSNPNWIPFGDKNLLYLDDAKINLIELAEEEDVYVQPNDVIIEKSWFPDPDLSEPSAALKNYFTVVCKSVVSSDEQLRKMALKDISENPRIGPVVEWLYRFGHFLLMKDITYDCFTLSALDLIETLENSPLGSANVSEKQLKLLMRLLLQRLLISTPSKETLKPMCSVLALLSLREPLKDMAIGKINEKLGHQGKVLPFLTAIYFLGIDAVREIFLPNMQYFLENIKPVQSETIQEEEFEMIYVVLGIYGLLCKADYTFSFIHEPFQEIFGNTLVIFWKPQFLSVKDFDREEIDRANMSSQLRKTRRKVDCNVRKGQVKPRLEDAFDIPTNSCTVKKKIDEHRMGLKQFKRETHITVGKTTLILPVLKCRKVKVYPRYCDHSLLSYNF
ncbi:hypothetical protein NQ315_010488 [Exocentrus adspersus]|uniref:Transcription initiation factor TFIID subunit 6 n=1 Tax=Exocentrus adspersus TaxID=1586481 RepID=A0AAV8W4Z1_9CUCU|nr:hypothetical protein NQ315_010488 [Exocentrus adspersus]